DQNSVLEIANMGNECSAVLNTQASVAQYHHQWLQALFARSYVGLYFIVEVSNGVLLGKNYEL
ncbi:unnamed protein product, partial [marine sediment metagenome]